MPLINYSCHLLKILLQNILIDTELLNKLKIDKKAEMKSIPTTEIEIMGIIKSSNQKILQNVKELPAGF